MKFTDAEWHIMKALWQQAPASARQIAERLPEDIQWAYTTIKTMLNRLVEKQVLALDEIQSRIAKLKASDSTG